MADKKKYLDPRRKGYGVKELLTLDRMSDAMEGLRLIQVRLWETMPDQTYEKLEKVFDTAMASLMAHTIGIEVKIEDEDDTDPEEGEPDGV